MVSRLTNKYIIQVSPMKLFFKVLLCPNVQIFFLDSCEDPGPADQDYPLLRKLEEKWMVTLGSLASLDPKQGWNKRDDAKAKAWRTGGT